ncbi:hypothetical protein GY45DRAFT_798080 [Cubamyces sp. BRFM 1775]|nr:hypothetical protein GY45DRAFT_798080 [Cubamyces sp. BRFM 1775]
MSHLVLAKQLLSHCPKPSSLLHSLSNPARTLKRSLASAHGICTANLGGEQHAVSTLDQRIPHETNGDSPELPAFSTTLSSVFANRQTKSPARAGRPCAHARTPWHSRHAGVHRHWLKPHFLSAGLTRPSPLPVLSESTAQWRTLLLRYRERLWRSPCPRAHLRAHHHWPSGAPRARSCAG